MKFSTLIKRAAGALRAIYDFYFTHPFEPYHAGGFECVGKLLITITIGAVIGFMARSHFLDLPATDDEVRMAAISSTCVGSVLKRTIEAHGNVLTKNTLELASSRCTAMDKAEADSKIVDRQTSILKSL